MIIYGWTKDEGFAVLDTELRVYVYGYPTSCLAEKAKKHPLECAIRESLDLNFLARVKSFAARRTIDEAYEHIYESMVERNLLSL